MEKPFGLGLGGVLSGTPPSREETISNNDKGVMQADSTIAAILTPFGTLGAILVIIAFCLVSIGLIRLKSSPGSSVEALKMLSFFLLALSPLDCVVYGPTGFLCWTIIGFICAAQSRAAKTLCLELRRSGCERMALV